MYWHRGICALGSAETLCRFVGARCPDLQVENDCWVMGPQVSPTALGSEDLLVEEAVCPQCSWRSKERL